MIPQFPNADDSQAQAVLCSRYSRLMGDGTPITPLGNAGGFSGSQLWRFSSPSCEWLGAGWFGPRPAPADLLLRRWPEAADRHDEFRRLNWIHEQLRQTRACQAVRIPCPVPSDRGETLIVDARGLWQVEPWLAGTPLCELDVSDTLIHEALKGLFDWYGATEAIPEPDSPSPPRGVSSSLQARRSLLSLWWKGNKTTVAFDELRALSHGYGEFATVSQRICQAFQCLVPAASDWLRRHGDVSLPLRTIHGDARADHFLVQPEAPVGLIDFGAMKRDCVVVDLARFAGSLAAPDSDVYRRIIGLWQRADLWQDADVDVFELARVLDLTGTLVAGMRWVKWVLADQLWIGTSAAALTRMQAIAKRLAAFVEKM